MWGQPCPCWTLQSWSLLCRCNLSKESGLFEYADSKILQLMLSKELNKRLKVGPCVWSDDRHFCRCAPTALY